MKVKSASPAIWRTKGGTKAASPPKPADSWSDPATRTSSTWNSATHGGHRGDEAAQPSERVPQQRQGAVHTGLPSWPAAR